MPISKSLDELQVYGSCRELVKKVKGYSEHRKRRGYYAILLVLSSIIVQSLTMFLSML
jgi:hypothetical protein